MKRLAKSFIISWFGVEWLLEFGSYFMLGGIRAALTGGLKVKSYKMVGNMSSVLRLC